MALAEPAESQFEIGRVISRTFWVIGRNIPTFVLIGLIFQVPSSTLSWLNDHFIRTRSAPLAMYEWPYLPLTLARLVIVVVLDYLGQAALATGAIAALNGRPVSIRECLLSPLRSAGPLTTMAIVSSIGIFGGLILFVVPGLLLSLRWMIIVPVLVIESGTPRHAFDRSSELTKDHRGALFGLLAMLLGVILAFQFGVARPLSRLLALPGTALVTSYTLFNVLIGLVQGIVSGVGAAVIYGELRRIKEGPSADTLAAVFS